MDELSNCHLISSRSTGLSPDLHCMPIHPLVELIPGEEWPCMELVTGLCLGPRLRIRRYICVYIYIYIYIHSPIGMHNPG